MFARFLSRSIVRVCVCARAGTCVHVEICEPTRYAVCTTTIGRVKVTCAASNTVPTVCVIHHKNELRSKCQQGRRNVLQISSSHVLCVVGYERGSEVHMCTATQRAE